MNFYSLRPPLILKHNNIDKIKHSVYEVLSKPRRLTREGLAWLIIVTMFGCVTLDIQIAEAYAVVEVEAVTTVVEPREVKLEVVYNWTPQRIEQEVMKVFPDAPIMLKVMRCEGGYDIDAHNPTNNSHDRGLFQISTKYHGAEIKRLELDMNNPVDNIKYARRLYDSQGLAPWSASKKCWSK